MNQKTKDAMERCHARNAGMCERCGEKSVEIAHGISKGSYGRKTIRIEWRLLFKEDLTELQLDDVVHHPLNTFPSCKTCNDSFNMHISHTTEIKQRLKEIHEELNSDTG